MKLKIGTNIMNNNTIDIIMCFVENGILILLLDMFCEVKSRKVESIFWLVFSLLSSCVNSMQHPLFSIIGLFIFIVYANVNYTNTTIRKFSVSFLVFCTNIVISFLIIACLKAQNTFLTVMLETHSVFYVACVLLAKFLLVSFMFFVLKYKEHYISTKLWIMILLEVIIFFIALIYIFYIFSLNAMVADQALVICSLFICMVIIVLLLYQKYCKEKLLNEKLQFKEKFDEEYLRNINEMKTLEDRVRKTIHDLGNEKLLISKYLEEGEVELAKELASKQISSEYLAIVSLENKMLEFIINEKYSVMKKNDIAFFTMIEDNLSFIQDRDLIIILGNMLDNAIEAQSQVSDKYVRLNIKKNPIGIKISLINRYTSVILKDGKYVTTKKDKKKHGIGIASIKDIITKYDAEYDITYKNGLFEFLILFVK